MTWSNNVKKIKTGSEFTISNINEEHEGTYTCIAKNSEGTNRKNFLVKVVDPPGFFLSLGDITIKKNEKSIVECYTSGYPDPETYWTFKGLKIKDGDKLELTSTMESGLYKCVAESSAGRAEMPFHFKVVAEPTLIEGFDKSGVDEKSLKAGKDLEISCPFEDFDEISWDFKGVTLTDQTNQKLIVKKVDEENAGEYKCTATNRAGSVLFTYQVKILQSPKIVIFDEKTSKYILKSFDMERKLFQDGHKMSLKCEVKGNPTPTINWKKSGDKVGEGESFEIESLLTTDSGSYSCEATNSEGTARKVFTVDVTSPPYIVDGVAEVVEERTVDDFIVLDCNIAGSEPLRLFWFKDE